MASFFPRNGRFYVSDRKVFGLRPYFIALQTIGGDLVAIFLEIFSSLRDVSISCSDVAETNCPQLWSRLRDISETLR